jgi:hypothetical protein
MNTKSIFVLLAATFCHNSVALAQTWTQAGPTNLYLVSVAMSAAGNKLAILSSGQHAIVSTDSGHTWQTNQTSPVYGTCVCSSADGTKLATFSLNGGNPGIYVSTNSGGTWEKTVSPSTFNVTSMSLAASADASILIESGSGSYIYVSTNSGLTWSIGGSPSHAWTSVASSADGTKLVAAASGGIYTSTNFGSTWTATTAPDAAWSSIACSADGNQLITSGSATYLSTNFGYDWRMASPQTGKLASSANGTRLVIAGNSMYTSSDSGATWISNGAPQFWTSIASSADGSELVANNRNSGIWIGRTLPSPQMNVASSTGNLALSWIIPSTNFVLQQNSNLTKANWSEVTNVPVLNLTNLQNQVTLPLPSSNQFYRLKTP